MSIKRKIQAGSGILLPLFSFPRFCFSLFQRFKGVGVKGPEIEGTKIASAFLCSACIFFLGYTVVIIVSPVVATFHGISICSFGARCVTLCSIAWFSEVRARAPMARRSTAMRARAVRTYARRASSATRARRVARSARVLGACLQ